MAGKRLRHVDSGVKISGNSGFSEEMFTIEVRARRTSGLVKSKAEVLQPEAKTLQTAAMSTVSGVPGFLALVVSGKGGGRRVRDPSWLVLALATI